MMSDYNHSLLFAANSSYENMERTYSQACEHPCCMNYYRELNIPISSEAFLAQPLPC